MYYYASKPHDMPDESREWTEKERQIFRDSFFNGNTLLPIKDHKMIWHMAVRYHSIVKMKGLEKNYD